MKGVLQFFLIVIIIIIFSVELFVLNAVTTGYIGFFFQTYRQSSKWLSETRQSL